MLSLVLQLLLDLIKINGIGLASVSLVWLVVGQSVVRLITMCIYHPIYQKQRNFVTLRQIIGKLLTKPIIIPMITAESPGIVLVRVLVIVTGLLTKTLYRSIINKAILFLVKYLNVQLSWLSVALELVNQ